MEKRIRDFSWAGNRETFVDQPDIKELGNIVLGRYGGNSSAGQYKNEDACLIWTDESGNWEFILLMDAHNTAESAEKVLEQFEANKTGLKKLLAQEITSEFFIQLEERVLETFQGEEFLEICRTVQGETACLIAVRKDNYLWWFSVGDCLLYVFHPELAAFGQYQLNQRQFYEWVGQVNTFDQPVPCFSSGTRELRQGENHLLMTTDGLVECPGEPYSKPEQVFGEFDGKSHVKGVQNLLEKIQENGVRDSTAIVSWKVGNLKKAVLASNQ